jgi:hypothetical protein
MDTRIVFLFIDAYLSEVEVNGGRVPRFTGGVRKKALPMAFTFG